MYPESIEKAIQPAWETTSTAPTPNIKKKKKFIWFLMHWEKGRAAFTLGIYNKMLTRAGAQRRENFPNHFKEKFCCSDGPESLSKTHVLKVQSESVGIRR